MRLAAQDLFVTDAPLDEARLKPGIHMRSAQDVPLDNDPLLRLLYGGRMIEFYEFFWKQRSVTFLTHLSLQSLLFWDHS